MNKLTIPQAAEKARVSRQTMWLWCRLHGIGERFGSIWIIDQAKLARHMEGRKHNADVGSASP